MTEIEATHGAPGQSLAAPKLLHWSPKSPFVRKVAMVIHECGLAGQVTFQRTVADRLAPDLAYMKRNPLGTIPALELSDGNTLCDSPVICEYLLAFSGNHALLPGSGPERFDVLHRQAFADGMLDAILVWRQEGLRPETEQSAALNSAYRIKADCALDAMEAEVGSWPKTLDLGQIAAGVALAYLDLRFAWLDWRAGRNRLSQWAAAFEMRESAIATRPALD
ncbi:MAG: glutathione S-transferase family protein [Blastomonas sp.]